MYRIQLCTMQVPAASARIMLKAARAIRSMALVSHSAQFQLREDRYIVTIVDRFFAFETCDISANRIAELSIMKLIFILCVYLFAY